jgi:hypothetical protein
LKLQVFDRDGNIIYPFADTTKKIFSTYGGAKGYYYTIRLDSTLLRSTAYQIRFIVHSDSTKKNTYKAKFTLKLVGIKEDGTWIWSRLREANEFEPSYNELYIVMPKRQGKIIT